MVLYLSAENVARVLTMDDVMRVSNEAYLDVDRGLAVNRPRTFCRTPTPSGSFSVNTMEGILPSKGVYSIRVSTGLTAISSTTHRSGDRESLHYLYDLETGGLLAIIQDGPIGQMRVQAINAIAARYMAKEHTKSMALIGSGYQAGAAIEAMKGVRPIERVTVYSVTPEHRTRFAAQKQKVHPEIEVRAADTAEEAVKGADMIVCATSSRTSVCKGEWLEPGMHLTAVLPSEFDLEAYKRADYIVIYNRLHARDYTLSRGPEEVPLKTPARASCLEGAPEMIDLVSGKAPGRRNDAEVTLFANGGHGWGLDGGPGYGVQLTAVAKLVYDLAKERGLGRELPFS